MAASLTHGSTLVIVSASWQREVAIYDLFKLINDRLREPHWAVCVFIVEILATLCRLFEARI